MTMPRRQLVDVAVTRYYHCISRCVRRAFLCGEGVTHRKAWIEARLELLAKHFAVSVCAHTTTTLEPPDSLGRWTFSIGNGGSSWDVVWIKRSWSSGSGGYRDMSGLA